MSARINTILIYVIPDMFSAEGPKYKNTCVLPFFPFPDTKLNIGGTVHFFNVTHSYYDTRNGRAVAYVQVADRNLIGNRGALHDILTAEGFIRTEDNED